MKLEIIDYGYSGEGVAKLNGKVFFVPLTIKGEEVEVNAVKDTKSFCKCKLSKVIKQSEKRISAPCPYFGECGGCSFQNLKYDNEIEIKKQLLQNQLLKTGYIKEIKVQKSDKEYFYRNKIKLFAKDDNLALNELESNNLVPIEKCIICKDLINDAIIKVQTFIKAKKIGFAIENVVIQSFEDKILVNFIMKEHDKIEFSGLQIMLGSNAGIFITNRGEAPKHVLGQKNIMTSSAIKQEISVATFHQVNDFVQGQLYSEVLKYCKDKIVINAYSGAGYLSGLLAKSSKLVYGIELGRGEHKDAEKLKELNEIFNLTNLNQDCAKAFENMNSIEADIVILDPPKAGCDASVVKNLNELQAKNIIYISCNPATLVRDLKLLSNFEIQDVKLFDMFPRTSSIETFVILKRNFEKS